MASRTSHLVNPEKGVLLYQNTGTKAELVSVHAVSHDTTKNPQLSFAVDPDNSRPLNFEKSLYSLPATLVPNSRIVDLDSRNNGTSVIYDRSVSTSLMGTSSGPFASGTQWPSRFLHVDPWMTVKPSEYGNATDNVCSLLTYGYPGNQWYYFDNILDDRASGAYNDLFSADSNPNNYTATAGFSYYNRGFAADQYTNMFMGWNNNAYMSFGGVWNGTGYGDSSRSSDSLLYQRHGTSFDTQSYESQSSTLSPLIYADGGVFVLNIRRYNSQNYSYVHIIPARYYFGDLPADKSTLALTATQFYTDAGGARYSDPVSSSGNWSCYFETGYQSYQWHKYNKANDKYYFCFKDSTASQAGIWEWEWIDMTQYNSITYGAMSNLTANGPGGAMPYNWTAGSWTRVADYPLALTDFMTPPSKVGANLWLAHSGGGVPYYSTDLKTWQSGTDYFSTINPLYLVANHGSTGEKFYGKSNTSSVVAPVSGFGDIPTAGLLEKNTPVGNFSRTGIILNAGDCLYSENADLATALSITVNAVDM